MKDLQSFFLIPCVILAINSSSCSIGQLHDEVIVQILSLPDKQKVNEIITIQKRVASERKINFDDTQITPRIIKSSIQQKSFIEIRNAFFPCIRLSMACKHFHNNEKLWPLVQTKLSEQLTTLIPQGIGLFLLPQSMQHNLSYFSKNHFWKEYSAQSKNLLEHICYQKQKIESLNQNLFLSHINEFFYESFQEGTFVYSPLEYVLYLQSHYTYCSKKINCYGTQFERHFFKILNHICLLPDIDLTLPAAQSEKNIANHIYDLITKNENFETLLSQEAWDKIDFARNLEARKPLPENILLLKELVQTLFNPPQLVKEALQKERHKIPTNHLLHITSQLKDNAWPMVIALCFYFLTIQNSFYDHI